jgi:hypothetical protein
MTERKKERSISMCCITNKVLFAVFYAGCIILFLAAAAFSEDGVLAGTPVTLSVQSGVSSKYIWRGFKLDGDPVLQTGVSAGAYGFTGTVWGSLDAVNDDALNSDEVDYIVDYTYAIDTSYSLSAGHTFYKFPGYDGESREFYIGAGMSTLLSPKLLWYRDYGDEENGGGDGDYYVLNLSHSIKAPDSSVSVDLSGHMGYNSGLFIAGKGWDAAFSAGLGIPLTSKCSLSPSISYSMPFGDLKDEGDGNQDNEFYAGALLTFNL